MKEFLKMLDGKKSLIGGACLFLGLILDNVVLNIWGVSAPWVAPAIATCEWVGGILFPTGMIHKVIKAKAEEAKP